MFYICVVVGHLIDLDLWLCSSDMCPLCAASLSKELMNIDCPVAFQHIFQSSIIFSLYVIITHLPTSAMYLYHFLCETPIYQTTVTAVFYDKPTLTWLSQSFSLLSGNKYFTPKIMSSNIQKVKVCFAFPELFQNPV